MEGRKFILVWEDNFEKRGLGTKIDFSAFLDYQVSDDGGFFLNCL